MAERVGNLPRSKTKRKEKKMREKRRHKFLFSSSFDVSFRLQIKKRWGAAPSKSVRELYKRCFSLAPSEQKGSRRKGRIRGPASSFQTPLLSPPFSFFIAHSSFRDEKKNSPLRKSVRFDFVCYCSDTLSLSISPVSKKKHAFFVWASPHFPVKSLRDNKAERESTEKGQGVETERFFWVFLFPLVALLSFPNGRARPKKRTSERNGPSSEGMRAGRVPSRCPRRPSR